MPEMSGGNISGEQGCSSFATEQSEMLPLDLPKTQVVPPAPNRRASAIDWLHDFGGFSWIAYGAASLLVISHCPSPSSREETKIGPFFKQVIEPPLRRPLPVDAAAATNGIAEVKAVAWCHARPSNGEVAAGLMDSVPVYAADATNARGSLCWRQIVVLVHSFIIEAIEWTQSGDGLIVVGSKVVSWERKNMSWEMSWKLEVSVVQTLVSATWSTNGPIATGTVPLPYSCIEEDERFSFPKASKRVLVICGDESSRISTVELFHPQPVSMIQWRPRVPQHKKNALHPWRDVLLTFCLDGVVRLWTEIDSGRVKRASSDQKNMLQSFHVIAVIELNNCLEGNLGSNMFISWATDVLFPLSEVGVTKELLSVEVSQADQVGHCEWLVGVGPGISFSFWSVHCLDDSFPLRFPRVNLWKKQCLPECGEESLSKLSTSSECQPTIIKALVGRKWLSSPPVECSLLQLLPDNSVSWSHFFTSAVPLVDGSSCETEKAKMLSCFKEASITADSHTGKILQVAVHPCSSEVELAVSLDSDGFLLFWSISSIIGAVSGMHVQADPFLQFVGKVSIKDLCNAVDCSTLCWAPSVLTDDRFLFLGHTEGIDLVLVQISLEENKNILHHKVLTIPLSFHNQRCAPDYITVTPLASSCKRPFVFNTFVLLAIWMKEFQISAWKIHMHFETCDVPTSSCGCLSVVQESKSRTWECESHFGSKTYFVSVDFYTMDFPITNECDKVTTVSALSPVKFYPYCQQMLVFHGNIYQHSFSHNIVTGHLDGSVRLWRIPLLREPDYHLGGRCLTWELVGMFNAHQGSVGGLALSSCATKIATFCKETSNGISNVHIWQFFPCLKGGSFLLDDKISIDGDIVALRLCSLGNGHSVLGVCLLNELHLYAPKRHCSPEPVRSRSPHDLQNWICIAKCHTYERAHGFQWGPRLTPVVIHERHLTVFGQFSAPKDKNNCKRSSDHTGSKENFLAADVSEVCQEFSCDSCGNTEICTTEDQFYNENGESCGLLQTDMKKYDAGRSFELLQQNNHAFCNGSWLSIIESVERSCEIFPAYHPKALLLHLYSGNWKRVYAILSLLVQFLNSNEDRSQNSCFSIPDMSLIDFFEEANNMGSRNEGSQWCYDIPRGEPTHCQQNLFQFADDNSLVHTSEGTYHSTSKRSEVKSFIDVIRKDNTENILNVDKIQLLAIIDLLDRIMDMEHASTYESFDISGRRFWVSVKFQHLYFLQKFGRIPAVGEIVVDSSMIAWASQSDCQDNLVSSLLSTKESWADMRSIGAGFWFTNTTQLRSRMEKLARLQYLKRKDPKDCALLYIALNRLQVLVGLFKISKEEKDKALVGFLTRNFQEEKNKLAAIKNAYVLMGKHQLELAIAFFLLGGDASSAVAVCAKNLGDEQLALVICRLLQGHGGLLENDLILNILLPNAIEKKDHWLASMLEWFLGNYLNSFKRLLDLNIDPKTDILVSSSIVFLDPNVSQYLVILASKGSLKQSAGDYMASVLYKWAMSANMVALNRSGFTLEALECLSSAFGTSERTPPNMLNIDGQKYFSGVNPFSGVACNWLLEDVAYHLQYCTRLNMVMQYVSKLVLENPCWAVNGPFSFECSKQLQKVKFDHSIYSAVSKFAKKYSINMADIMHLILFSADNHLMLFLGYEVLHRYIFQENVDQKSHIVDSFFIDPVLPGLLKRSSNDIISFLATYTFSCGFAGIASTLGFRKGFSTHAYGEFYSSGLSLRILINLVRAFRPLLNLYTGHDFHFIALGLFDLLEFCMHLASAWVERDLKRLILLTFSILHARASGESFIKSIDGNLVKFLQQSLELISQMESIDRVNHNQGEHEAQISAISESEQWNLIGICMWRQFFDLSEYELGILMSGNLEEGNDVPELIRALPRMLADLLTLLIAFLSSSMTKCVKSFLMGKMENGMHMDTLTWLLEFKKSQNNASLQPPTLKTRSLLLAEEDEKSLFKMLWEFYVDPKEVLGYLNIEVLNDFSIVSQKYPLSWNDIHERIIAEYAARGETVKQAADCSIAANAEGVLHSTVQEDSSESFLVNRIKNIVLRDLTYFYNPEEVYKRNGELLEAICYNSIDECQIALASNRKGLLFVNLESHVPTKDEAQYIWSDSDWPCGGWARCESTPVPTFVSPGVGLGDRKGTHLGLGGATIGVGSLARPGRDLTGGGAFGIPGYAGIGASGLGWGEQEDFEDFIDPPATIENIRTRALSSHPSKPLFLVGSSNTHVYLWEFGKDSATATYGVLPAANVPPPYALASISALQFDCCGQRFATAALDGTVCTWQLEVGGRSNVRPIDSSLCFNKHASAISYIAASGSIVATAGYSTTNANIVIWDTLAPAATSQASINCHEGGARSLSVFNNDIGIGSISPMIITGGKIGDIGLHDFRYIATGKSKRHKHSSERNFETAGLSVANKFTENVNGMIWHIPKAHSGSVTKIVTVPNTSFILSGSKDGDVKLWDAKRCELVFHWSKLHERHTFLQPGSRGFGGVVRAAVTDIQVLSRGFLTCGGDGSVKLVKLEGCTF